jgi:DnaJ domain
VAAEKALFVASCSVTTTRRRRFMWVAWWSAPPAREPFRKPDAFSGGARSHEEALAQARRAAGVLLVEIEPYWAGAWARVLLGRPPWGVRREGGASSDAQGRSSDRPTAAAKAAKANTTSIWETLGITARATAHDLKRAFRQRALATHPDRGGDAEAFRQVQRAFKEAQRRIARRRPARTGAR